MKIENGGHSMECICVAKINLQCNMQMAMQYVKWSFISIFKFTFSHTCVQHLMQMKMKIQLYNLK